MYIPSKLREELLMRVKQDQRSVGYFKFHGLLVMAGILDDFGSLTSRIIDNGLLWICIVNRSRRRRPYQLYFSISVKEDNIKWIDAKYNYPNEQKIYIEPISIQESKYPEKYFTTPFTVKSHGIATIVITLNQAIDINLVFTVYRAKSAVKSIEFNMELLESSLTSIENKLEDFI